MQGLRFKKEQLIGPIGITLLAAALFGLYGTVAQVLFQVYNFPPFGLAAIRALLGGLIFLAYFRPKWPKGNSLVLLKYAILGILPSQLFYFITIGYSNVVTAVLLQYLFLPMVIIYEGFTGRFRFTNARTGMILLAILGILLVLLGGAGGLHLLITPIALVTGILSALGAAYYTLFSRPLTTKNSPWSITTWSFLIVGLITLPFGIWAFMHTNVVIATSSIPIVLALILVVVLGGAIPYGLVLRALKKLGSTEVSVIQTTEPVFAAVGSFLIFGALLSGLQYFGGALMLLAIIILKIITPEEKVS